jgi:prophage tail gpP-like protein
MNLSGLLKINAAFLLIILFSFTSTAAQTPNGEIKITEKSDLFQNPHKSKKGEKKRAKNRNPRKKKHHRAKMKKKLRQQGSLSQKRLLQAEAKTDK